MTVQAQNALLLVRSHDSHASCEQHVLRTTNVPLRRDHALFNASRDSRQSAALSSGWAGHDMALAGARRLDHDVAPHTSKRVGHDMALHASKRPSVACRAGGQPRIGDFIGRRFVRPRIAQPSVCPVRSPQRRPGKADGSRTRSIAAPGRGTCAGTLPQARRGWVS
jgi:hypothetical protein